MLRKNQLLYSWLVVVMMICTPAVLVDARQGRRHSPAPPGILLPGFNVPSFPGLLPPIYGGETNKCWSSLRGIEGCANGILRARFGNRFVFISPACCKAFIAIDEHCWPKMFPFVPFFPPFINRTCTASLN